MIQYRTCLTLYEVGPDELDFMRRVVREKTPLSSKIMRRMDRRKRGSYHRHISCRNDGMHLQEHVFYGKNRYYNLRFSPDGFFQEQYGSYLFQLNEFGAIYGTELHHDGIHSPVKLDAMAIAYSENAVVEEHAHYQATAEGGQERYTLVHNDKHPRAHLSRTYVKSLFR